MISAKEVEKSKATIINVLTPEAFAKEHIPQSKNFCIYEIAFLDKIKEEFSTEDELIVHGQSRDTQESDVAYQRLVDAGFSVQNFKGGLLEWKTQGFAIESENSEKISKKEFVLNAEESKVEWTGRNIGNKHVGGIKVKEGSIQYDESLSAKIVLDMNSISNFDVKDPKYNEMLVHHLKSDDFFDVKNFPQAQIEILSLEEGIIKANLTIKDITQEISFPAQINFKEEKLVVNAHFDIDRSKWKIKYGSSSFFAKLGMHFISDIVSFDVILIAE